MLKVALVNPAQATRYPQPPMGLALIAALLEKAGYPVTVVDDNALQLKPGEITQLVKDADVVGLSATTPTINIATGREITILNMVKAIARELEYEGDFIFEPERAADVRRHRGDITLANNLFGFEAGTEFDDGIKETVAWYRENIAQDS